MNTLPAPRVESGSASAAAAKAEGFSTEHEAQPLTRKFYIVWLTIAISVLCFDLSVPLGVAAGVPYIILVLYSLRSTRQKTTYATAIIATVLTIIGFVASPTGGELWKVITNRLLAFMAIWVTAVVCLLQKRHAQAEVQARLDQLAAKREMEALVIANRTAEQAVQVSEDANRAKSEFLANMSHEIRTPMTAILGFSEIALSNAKEEESIQVLQIVRQNGEYLLGIINDILDLSKIESGKLDVEYIACSPSDVARDVWQLMQTRATAKGIALELDFRGPIPKCILSDPTRLRQILINLVGNAVKFTETGQVRLVVQLHEHGAAGKLRFDVIDTGIGIGEQHIPRLFAPFGQADASTTRRFGGTGLGLTISNRLAEMLGGNIRVTSKVGEGSMFSLEIDTGPLAGVQFVEETPDSSTPAPAAESACEVREDLACRVLLAEDGPDNQRLISFVLKKAGSEVAVADNGEIAVDLAMTALREGNPFDVILMDMQMPVLDGYSATSQLRAAGYSGPIIALTAHAMSDDRKKCVAAGCDDYATKPINRNGLISLVAQYALQKEVAEV
ncbi:MAG: ATP-binding protein [Pirellulales bacterium]|nr:ATP-binding protein [Pirellulales bacterium]